MAESKFTHKTCLITGAGSGIGRATAVRMVSLGARVYITDIDAQGLEETRRQCGEQCISGVMDVSNAEQCNQLASGLKGDGIDFVFNCAGVNPTAYPLTETTDAYYNKLMDVNVRGTYNVTRACIPHMRPAGSFVNVSSIMGVTASAEMAIYCATKWAIVGFTKAMSLELGPKGLRCNAVAPGYIDTPTNAGVLAGPEAVRAAEADIAMGRMGTPEEVAEVVVFLFR